MGWRLAFCRKMELIVDLAYMSCSFMWSGNNVVIAFFVFGKKPSETECIERHCWRSRTVNGRFETKGRSYVVSTAVGGFWG